MMGSGFYFKCNKCDHDNEYLFGIGFLFSSLESVIDLLPGKKLQMAKDLYENNKEAEFTYDGYEVYQCEKCASVQNTFLVEARDKNKKILFSSVNNCSRCKQPRKKIKHTETEIKNFKCPKCKSDDLTYMPGVMWD